MANITITHPEIAKQWHPTKNGDLRAENFKKSNSKDTIWWLCNKPSVCGCLHEWQSTIKNRTKRGNGCPFCSPNRLKVCVHTSIVGTHPEIAKQWHPTKNGDLKAENFPSGSGKEIWWLCDETFDCGCLHEYPARIDHRIGSKSGCSICSHRILCCNQQSILITHPEIAKQWHPTKNGKLTPDNFREKSSSDEIWWICDKKCAYGCLHEWQTTIANRTSGCGCPYCCIPRKQLCEHDSIKYTHPKIAEQWHPTKNGELKPEQFSFGSHEENTWWLCDKTCDYGCNHEYQSTISNRCNGHGCPFCENQQSCIHTSIVYTNPKLVKQWHPTKNGCLLPENFTYGSGQRIWWVCDKKHEWESTIDNRRNRGCPYCRNKTEQKLYDALIPQYPKLEREFRVEWCMNINQLPYDFVLKEDKIIIELDGPQHFEQVSNWKSPEETHMNDIHKMKCAKANGYSVIRLLQTDVFYDTYDWLTELRANIEKIKAEQRLQRVYMCKDNEYAVFNKLVRKYKLIWKERCVLCNVNHPVEQSSQCNKK
jgi:very-short-patch-repair endonuclease